MSSILECSDELILNLSKSDFFLTAKCLASATRIKNKGIEEKVIERLLEALGNGVRENAASALGEIGSGSEKTIKILEEKLAPLDNKSKIS